MKPLFKTGLNRQYVIAFIWGFAEATFFFFIPDIYLTRIAITDGKRAYIACLIAAFAAVLGGLLMYGLATEYYASVKVFLSYIPAISMAFVDSVSRHVQQQPYLTLLLAPTKGIPYKIVASIFGGLKLNILAFIVVSYIARLLRFVITTTITIFARHGLAKIITTKSLYLVHAIAWCLIYISYFYLMR